MFLACLGTPMKNCEPRSCSFVSCYLYTKEKTRSTFPSCVFRGGCFYIVTTPPPIPILDGEDVFRRRVKYLNQLLEWNTASFWIPVIVTALLLDSVPKVVLPRFWIPSISSPLHTSRNLKTKTCVVQEKNYISFSKVVTNSNQGLKYASKCLVVANRDIIFAKGGYISRLFQSL